MAHSCPRCGMICHCGGDIDDLCFEDTPEEAGCTHCPDDDEIDDHCLFCGCLYPCGCNGQFDMETDNETETD